jgi:hypothetical protein
MTNKLRVRCPQRTKFHLATTSPCGQRTLQVLRVLVSISAIRDYPTDAVRVTVAETYFASCKANFRTSILTR